MTSGGSSSNAPQEAAPQEYQPQAQAPASPYGYQHQEQQQGGPCQFEMNQFIQCTQGQSDITLCQGFNEALKQCRMNNGMLKNRRYTPIVYLLFECFTESTNVDYWGLIR